MGVTYSILRRLWPALPESLRDHAVIQQLKETMKALLVSHNEIYTPDYFSKKVDPPAVRAAPIIAKSIIDDLRPELVIDVGCGTGALLKALHDKGCSCLGLECARAALKVCRLRGLNVRKFDIERDRLRRYWVTYDVAISMEVAEHLPARSAERFVDLLSTLAPTIVFTAATPGQGGKDHVNEQPHEYWIMRFGKRGFALDSVLSDKWRSQWRRESIASWYYRNIMVFRQE